MAGDSSLLGWMGVGMDGSKRMGLVGSPGKLGGMSAGNTIGKLGNNISPRTRNGYEIPISYLNVKRVW